jgi:hypothetical protein
MNPTLPILSVDDDVVMKCVEEEHFESVDVS